MTDALTFSDIVKEIVSKGTTRGARTENDVDSQIGILRDSWEAMDSWINSTLCAQKGIHIPSLCKMTWEFLNGSGPASNEEVQMRPVFILTETFIRGLKLNSYQRPVLPSSTVPCEDINFSQVAIKHSNSLTKDVLFVALRDIIRKISEHVASGRCICLNLTVGKLNAKGRRVWFDFDPSAFAEMGGDVSDVAVPPVWERAQTPARVEPQEDSGRSEPRASSRGGAAISRDETKACRVGPGVAAAAAAVSEHGQMDALHRALVGTGGGGDACVEAAYQRLVSDMESEAKAMESMERSISERQAAVYGEADRRRAEHTAHTHIVQKAIKEHISRNEAARRLAEEARMKPSALSAAPILTRDAGVADILGATPLPPSVDEGLLTPRSLMVHRMRSRITDGGVRGKSKALADRGQLLSSLKEQIGAKESFAKSRKEAELEEERRYLEHVKAEMHLHTTYARSNELTKQRDLLAAWERDGHLKNLNKLKSLGPSAMHNYAREVLAPMNSTMAAGSISSSGGLSARSTSSSRAGYLSARRATGVGFDPRST